MTKTIALLLAVAAAGNSAWAQSVKTAPEGKAYTIRSAAAAAGGTPAYQWYRNNVPITNATSASYTVPEYLAYGTNEEFKRRADCGGENVVWSNAVLVSFVPTQLSKITGDEIVCYNQTNNHIYSVPNVSSVTFTWAVPSGWTITRGQGSNIIAVTTPSTAGIGTISVTPSCTNYGYAVTGTTRTLAVTIMQGVSTPSAIAGSTSVVCEQSYTYSVTNTPGVTYEWDGPVGWIITAGQGTNSVTATAGLGGSIRATPSACGNSTYPSTLTVTSTGCWGNCADGKGTVINNLCWANKNVGQPGTFTATAHEYSPYYQWYKAKAWAATGSITGWEENGIGDFDSGNPCPSGWRIPSHIEFSNDLSTIGGTWAAAGAKGNTVAGVFLGPNHATCSINGSMQYCIFLPAGGTRSGNGAPQTGNATSWTGFPNLSNPAQAWQFSFGSSGENSTFTPKTTAVPVRCVMDL